MSPTPCDSRAYAVSTMTSCLSPKANVDAASELVTRRLGFPPFLGLCKVSHREGGEPRCCPSPRSLSSFPKYMGQCANKIMGLAAGGLRGRCETEKGRIFLTCSVICSVICNLEPRNIGTESGHSSLTRMWLIFQER